MNPATQEHRDHGFALGVVTGTFVGAGLAIWLAPRLATELRQRLSDTARSLGDRAAEQYRYAGRRVDDVVDDVTRRGQALRDEAAEAVARGAREVERYATAVKSDC